jgi:hypothetical protein
VTAKSLQHPNRCLSKKQNTFLNASNKQSLIIMRKFVFGAVILAILVGSVLFATVSADVGVGVKKGDWIQYNVRVTGHPPGDHDIRSAGMNITDVNGTAITLDIQTVFNNGTLYPEYITLNLATGILGDDFFIPKNLNVGDSFFDAYQGNIKITSQQTQDLAGARRTVILGSSTYTHYTWDKETGTLVAARSVEPDYTMTTNTGATNIWSQDIAGLSPSVFTATIAAIVVVAAALAFICGRWIIQRKQKPLLLALEVVGGVFVALFLIGYLAGMPTTTVYHSDPVLRIPLDVLGVALLIFILANIVSAVRGWSTFKSFSPLKLGLLIVTASYFLFNLHSLFTLEWIGEWNRFGGGFSTPVFIQDTTNFVGIIARFIGGVLAIVAVLYYYRKGLPSEGKLYKILRWVLFLEAFYWLSLVPQAGIDLYYAFSRHMSLGALFNNLAWTTIPGIVEAIVPPVALLILAVKLNPSKPFRDVAKWTLISGVTYVLTFWLTNMGFWMQVVDSEKGIPYLTNYPQHLFSFAITAVGLLVLAIYAGFFAWKNSGASSPADLNIRAIATIVTLLGLYFLWNYLSWVFFNGGWSSWYAWFLGHNLDLWMLSLPLLGVALLFYKPEPKKPAETANSA